MPKRPAREMDTVNSKSLPISCGHPPPEKHKSDELSMHSRCSRVAYTGCQQCILKYLYTVYKKKNSHNVERAKRFVCECVVFQSELPIEEVYKTLKFCHSIGLILRYEVFEFESRFTRKQILWLLKHGVQYYCLDIEDIITKGYWEIINFIASNENVYNEIVESKKPVLFTIQYYPYCAIIYL